MAKFSFLLTIGFATIIPNTHGNVELPAAALEFLEDMKPLVPKLQPMITYCIYSSWRNDGEMEKCIENFAETDAEFWMLKNKLVALKETLTQEQLNELVERSRGLLAEPVEQPSPPQPTATECIEELKSWYLRADSECRAKSTTDGELNTKSYKKCVPNWFKRHWGFVGFQGKCDFVMGALSPEQKVEKQELEKKLFGRV